MSDGTATSWRTIPAERLHARARIRKDLEVAGVIAGDRDRIDRHRLETGGHREGPRRARVSDGHGAKRQGERTDAEGRWLPGRGPIAGRLARKIGGQLRPPRDGSPAWQPSSLLVRSLISRVTIGNSTQRGPSRLGPVSGRCRQLRSPAMTRRLGAAFGYVLRGREGLFPPGDRAHDVCGSSEPWQRREASVDRPRPPGRPNGLVDRHRACYCEHLHDSQPEVHLKQRQRPWRARRTTPRDLRHGSIRSQIGALYARRTSAPRTAARAAGKLDEAARR